MMESYIVEYRTLTAFHTTRYLVLWLVDNINGSNAVVHMTFDC